MSEGIKEPFFLGQDELVFLSRQRTQPDTDRIQIQDPEMDS